MAESLDAIQKRLQAYTERNDAAPKGIVGELLERGKAIYGGVDSRTEVHASRVPPTVRDAVCVLFDADRLRPAPGGFRLQTRPFGDTFRLCPGQPFAHQPILGFGSGFLVAPDLVATAGHCVQGREVTEVVFLFDYDAHGDEVDHDRTPDRVYFGAEVLKAVLTPGADYALVRLDRPVTRVTPLPILAEELQNGDEVYVVGHPAGLPKKYAGGAFVTDASPEDYFVANLDTFAGNSGSPVLDADHRVRGILVRGATDFVYDGDCRVMATFPLYQAGEHVCRASVWRHLVNTKRGGRVQEVRPSTPREPTAREEPGPDPYEELEKYLLSAYSVEELRPLARYGAGEDIVRRVDFRQAPLHVVSQLVRELTANKAITAKLFERMGMDRPRRQDEIDVILRLFVEVGVIVGVKVGNEPPPAPHPPEPAAVGELSDRERAFDALLRLTPGELETLVEFRIDETARQYVRGVERVTSQAIALVNHYDVPHRGLRLLMDLIEQSKGRA